MSKAAELAKWGEVSTNGQVSGRRNIVINGAMNVAQRSASVTGIGATSGYYTIDRYQIIAGATAGRFTMAQVADVHDGFANAMKLTCTTADASIAAGEYMGIHYRIEGQDLQQIKKGTSDAEKVTISFYVKGNASATYMLEVKDSDNTRLNQNQFAVTTDWTRIEITLNADTTGAFTDDNGLSLELSFWLHGGSTYTSGTYTANTWAGQTNANRLVGISSFFDSTDRTFFLTGLQMEVGSVATPFEHRSFGEELALCQRYFYRWKTDGEAYSNLCIGGCTSTSVARGVAQLPQIMRSNASVSSSGTFRIVSMGAGVRTGITITINRGHTLQPFMDFSSSGGSNLTAGNPAEMGANNDNDSIIDFNAEL